MTSGLWEKVCIVPFSLTMIDQKVPGLHDSASQKRRALKLLRGRFVPVPSTRWAQSRYVTPIAYKWVFFVLLTSGFWAYFVCLSDAVPCRSFIDPQVFHEFPPNCSPQAKLADPRAWRRHCHSENLRKTCSIGWLIYLRKKLPKTHQKGTWTQAVCKERMIFQPLATPKVSQFAPEKLLGPKSKGSFSKHHFLGAFAVKHRWCNGWTDHPPWIQPGLDTPTTPNGVLAPCRPKKINNLQWLVAFGGISF